MKSKSTRSEAEKIWADYDALTNRQEELEHKWEQARDPLWDYVRALHYAASWLLEYLSGDAEEAEDEGDPETWYALQEMSKHIARLAARGLAESRIVADIDAELHQVKERIAELGARPEQRAEWEQWKRERNEFHAKQLRNAKRRWRKQDKEEAEARKAAAS